MSSRNSFPKDKVTREWNSLSQRISTFLNSIKNYFHRLKTLRMCVCVCVGKWPLEQLVVLSGPGLMDTTVIFSWISWEIQHWPSHQIPLDNPSILPKKPTHTQGQDQRGSGRTHRTGCGCYSSILWNIERGFSPRTKSSFCWNGTLPGPSKRGCFLTTLCSALTFLLQVKCPFACHESMWMEVSGQFHALAVLTVGKEPPVDIMMLNALQSFVWAL